MSEKLLEHLEDLKKRAIGEKQKYTDKFKKYDKYYSGEFNETNYSSQYNIIKGIVEAKTSLILDNEIVSSVIPRTKSFADIKQINIMQDLSDVLNDCNKNVLVNNNKDTLKRELVFNANKYGCGIWETTWHQDDVDNLGDIKISSICPTKFYPDLSAKTVQDMNYCFIEEVYSSATLKKKYPEHADKIKPQETSEEGVTDYSLKKPTGTAITDTDGFINQIYTYGEGQESIEESKNIKVWKCYLKDDSTFLDEDEDGKKNLRFNYPNGRLLVYIDGAKDYLLEDKAIDYPFGFPIDIFRFGEGILGDSPVKYLTEMQDRINKAFERIRYLIGAYMSAAVITADSGLNANNFINQTVLMVEEKQFGPEVFTNNTLSEISTLLEYIRYLKDAAYEIARINPQLISGERPAGVTSGAQIEALNESPMTSIREAQKILKETIISQGNKNITLIQLFYNLPRIIRISEGKEYVQIPMQTPEGVDSNPIQIYEKGEEGLIVKREIKGDLSIGEYEIEVIAGTELPRSRTEKAALTMQLVQMGIIDVTTIEGVNTLLTALDYPERRALVEQKEQQQLELSQNAPPVNLPLELAEKIFKDMPMQQQQEYLVQFGFEPLTAEQGAIEQIKELK